MSQQQEEEQKSEEPGAPGWMVTFADLMTLLLTFFVLLLSMSTLDNQRVKLALGSLRGSTGVLDGGGQPREGRKEVVQIPEVSQGDTKHLMTRIERVTEQTLDKASNDMIQIGHKDEKVIMSIPDSLLFAPGHTDINPVAYPFLQDLAAVVGQSESTVEVVGHSDDTGPSGYYSSNWEVGAARALAVLLYIQTEGGVEGHRLKASTHGEFHPKVENLTELGRAKNRRVELVVTVTSASDRYFYGEERKAPPVFPRGDADGGM
jgi:chemotaxis protein MotB